MGEQLTIVMISMHTSPLAQPGQGDAGGMNVYIRNLTKALIDAGHQVLGFTRKTSATDSVVVLDEITDSRIIPLSAGRMDLPKEALGELTTQFGQKLISSVANHANHSVVVHSHYWLSGVVALDVAAELDAPVIHTMHTLAATKNHSMPGTEPQHRIEREAYICALADVITANTEVEKHDLIQHTRVKDQRVEVVSPGVDHRIFHPNGPSHWPGNAASAGPRVLFAGRFQRYKGPHVLLEALAMLRDRGIAPLPTVHFTGATSGQSDYELGSYAHLLGVSSLCSFSAPVYPETLATYMRAADAVAMPSASESFGLVAIEAQASGTPVLAHRVGGLTTAVADGAGGRLLDSLAPQDWAEAMASLVDDPSRWRAYGIAAAQYAAGFTWSAMAERMIDIYSAATAAVCAS